MTDPTPVAVIGGLGTGLSAHLAARLAARGYRVAGLSRRGTPPPAAAPDCRSYACDIADAAAVAAAFAAIRTELGAPSLYIHNASQRVIGDFLETAPEDFERLWRTACLGAVLCAQQVLPDMLAAGRGTLIFTGATGSLRGGARFSAFASSKFAVRALAQSLARAYGARGIHVAHVVIDGIIWSDSVAERHGMAQEDCLDPGAIADAYLALADQPPSCWSHEIDLRVAKESF
ncbi:MAG: SDR family NAD(P)-dependent oxidoreductase [Rhodospirillaceae bacterium]|nr:SDR family NAD(P)-dependent oxidoreductase [Rhodospirillaceae bacterium]